MYTNLVFEGGVVLGIAYGGVLTKLEELKITHDIKRVAGTSAGAITAVLVSMGYKAQRFTEILKGTDFSSFTDDNFFQMWGGFLDKYGIYNGNHFKTWLGENINPQSGRFNTGELTFSQHQELVEADTTNAYKELYLIGTNLSQKIAEIYSYKTTPDMKIIDAARISMSVPLYFEAVHENGDVKVDGGCLWNYPVDVFDSMAYNPDPNNTEKVSYIDYEKNPDFVFNKETLGFRLGHEDEALYRKNSSLYSKGSKINDIKEYALVLATLFQEMANKLHLHENDWNRTVFINTGSIDAFNFKLTEDQKGILIKAGYECTEKFFKTKDVTDENQQLKVENARLAQEIEKLKSQTHS